MKKNNYYTKGRRAKELLNIYRNPYKQGTYEWAEWKKGFNEGIYEPIDFEVELPDCDDVFSEFEPIPINK